MVTIIDLISSATPHSRIINACCSYSGKNLSTILNKLIKVHYMMIAKISFNKQFWLPCISLATIWYKPHCSFVAAHTTNEQTSQINDIQFHWLVNIQSNIQLKFDWFRWRVRVCVCASTNPNQCNANEFYSYSKVIEKLFMISYLKSNENYKLHFTHRIQPHQSTFLSFSKTNSNFHMIFSFNNRQYAYDVFYCWIFFGSSKHTFFRCRSTLCNE